MAVEIDISLIRQEDVVATLSMTPPTAVASWTIELNITKRMGGETRYKLSYASGYDTVSGIHILDSGAGIVSLRVPSSATSGWEYGNYAYQVVRLDSGSRTVTTEGYLLVNP